MSFRGSAASRGIYSSGNLYLVLIHPPTWWIPPLRYATVGMTFVFGFGRYKFECTTIPAPGGRMAADCRRYTRYVQQTTQCSGDDSSPASPARGWQRGCDEYECPTGGLTANGGAPRSESKSIDCRGQSHNNPIGRLPPLHRIRPTLYRFMIRPGHRYVAGGRLPPLRYICFVLPRIQRVCHCFAPVKCQKRGTLM